MQKQSLLRYFTGQISSKIINELINNSKNLKVFWRWTVNVRLRHNLMLFMVGGFNFKSVSIKYSTMQMINKKSRYTTSCLFVCLFFFKQGQLVLSTSTALTLRWMERLDRLWQVHFWHMWTGTQTSQTWTVKSTVSAWIVTMAGGTFSFAASNCRLFVKSKVYTNICLFSFVFFLSFLVSGCGHRTERPV